MNDQSAGIVHSVEGDVLIVAFEQTVTPEREESTSIGKRLAELTAEHGGPVLVDLHMLQLVSGELMGQILALSKTLKTQGRRLAVCRLRPEVLKFYDQLDLDRGLPRFDSREEAIRWFAAEEPQ